MIQHRVISFIDGFNLYHAISNLHRPELKWVDLRLLSKAFVRPLSETLVKVFYFSAYADHMPELVQKSQKEILTEMAMRQGADLLSERRAI